MERELEDDYPIYPGYLYIVDDQVYRHNYPPTTAGVMRKQFKSVKNCDIAERNLWKEMV